MRGPFRLPAGDGWQAGSRLRILAWSQEVDRRLRSDFLMPRSNFGGGNTSHLKTFKSLGLRYKRFTCQSLSSRPFTLHRGLSEQGGHGLGHRRFVALGAEGREAS
ncbi:hypothetical protein KL86PLE_100742 [uncultured Pleomorphomonas sp.]|uniref:Uncharacterized protein n=1 Tax=uncultured Pleomorphomonas sp. TaxID=442121 RepID=A0A212L5L4_9HYPH|nr:hypothetical protein KL86PLE_100742 [uncultured Pleomorphomonas sp.]